MKKAFTPYLVLLAAGLSLPSALQAQELYSNGPFITGTVTKSGVTAPTGYTWSEVQNDAANTAVSNTSSGYTVARALGFNLADDFVVPAGTSWTIRDLSFFEYLTGSTSATTSPFTELYVRIWSGAPNVSSSQVLFGDLTTNRLAGSTNTFSYRIFNSLYPTASAPGTTRRIWKVRAAVSPALTLPAGTYWVEWSTNVTGNASHFAVPITIVGSRTRPGANSLQFNAATGAWAPVTDAGNPDTPPAVALDFPFIINDGTVTSTASAKNTGPALRVGPVPTSDKLQVELDALRSASDLELTDIQGRRVWTGKAAAKVTTVSVPMETLAAGVYTLSVNSAEGINRVRVVKQ